MWETMWGSVGPDPDVPKTTKVHLEVELNGDNHVTTLRVQEHLFNMEEAMEMAVARIERLEEIADFERV